MFRIRKVHISSLAMWGLLPRSCSSCFRAFMASIPVGVQAQPSPSRLAMKLAQISGTAAWSRGSFGKRKWMRGSIFCESRLVRPEPSAMARKPDHMLTTPAMTKSSSTASWAESIIPLLTVSKLPVKAATIIPMIMRPDQI